MKKLLRNDNFFGLLLTFIAFSVYLKTLASTIQYEDCGELAAAMATLGITHPTGYPLLTMLGWAVVHFPFDARAIVKLNVFVALLCSGAVFFFYRSFLLLLSTKAVEDKDISLNRIAAAIGALVLAFSKTFWSQAVSFEVYALHLFFVSLVLVFFLSSLSEGGPGSRSGANRGWLLFAFVLGLSFTNHMMTILLAPAFLYLYFSTYGFGRASWAKIGIAVVPFLIPLSLYLYLPLRAAQKPAMNWGNPVALDAFWRHISGREYRFMMFSSVEIAAMQFRRFLVSFPAEFGYVPLAFALLGLGSLWRRNRKALIFSLLLFLGCLFYSVNYNTPEIDPYFLLAYVAAAIWIVFGIRSFMEFAKGRTQKWAAGFLSASLILWPLCRNYRAVDASRDYAVEDYARNVLASLDSGGVILSYDWTVFLPVAYYLQQVEGVRPDVVLIDRQLLTSWGYYAQLEQWYPWLVDSSRAEVRVFQELLYRAEHDMPNDPFVTDVRYREMIHSFLLKSSRTRPVYATLEIEQEYTEGFREVSAGLAFRLLPDTQTVTVSPMEYAIRPFVKNDPSIERIKDMYALAYLNQGLYWAVEKRDTVTGVNLMRKSFSVKPGYPDAVATLQRLGQEP